MSEWKIEAVLRQSYLDVGIPAGRTAFPNREFTPPAEDLIWYAVDNMPASRDPNTLGDAGEDLQVGVYQIDLSGPQGQGVRPMLEAAGVLTAYYKAGRSFTKDGQVVQVRKSEISAPRRDGVRLVMSVSVYWSSAIPR